MHPSSCLFKRRCNYASLARLYNNSVIYSHNPVLWSIDLNSTNATRLLPDTNPQ